MAFKYTGDATLGVSLTVETPKPLDVRTVVNNLDELYSIPEEYAYQGMTVANIDNGNIYMLIDKAKINSKEGWKASYESILIITCTEDEYKEWSSNTTDDFKPIDENKTYLHAETYYYIYEDSMDDDLFYLSASWGKLIEESLKQKALSSTVSQIRADLDDSILNLNSNYITSSEISLSYATKNDIDLSNPESVLSKALDNHYTKKETDDIFVTKESLRGDGIEGDDFVFVTKKEYDENKLLVQNELSETIKTESDGLLNSLTVKQIKSPEVENLLLVIDLKLDGVYISDKKIATQSDIPNLVTLPEEEYQEKVENGTLEEDTYYYTYGLDSQNTGYITASYLDLRYYTRSEVELLILNAILELRTEIGLT